MKPAGTVTLGVPRPVTCLPQAESTIETATTTKLSQRKLVLTRHLAEYGAAVVAAVGLSLGFPKAGIAWLVPLALIPLWWAWSKRTPAQAARLGYVAGVVYFTLMFSWFGDTAGALLGPFGFVLALLPAAVEALAFAACGALSAYATGRLSPGLWPLACASAFTFCEWARSTGLLGVPFAQLGVTQVEGPLAPLAAYVGSYGVTFTLVLISAYLYVALASPAWRRTSAAALAVVAACTAAAWWFWPSRTLAPASIPVVAVQGNVKQGLKWNPQSIRLAIERYTRLTMNAESFHPRLVVWPETVIAEYLSSDASLREAFAVLARRIGAPLIVGSIDQPDAAHYYNALWIFEPDGSERIYRKHQLVPFAEFLPAASVLGGLPGAQFVSRFSSAPFAGVEPAGSLLIGPLICWESAFADLAYQQAREGAQMLVVATDDGWFGTTSGPYQHAQIAQMRAIETGRWVVRSAATGISEIIAPNGRVTSHALLDVEAALHAKVGPPQPTLFSLIGPYSIALAVFVLYVALVGRRSAGSR